MDKRVRAFIGDCIYITEKDLVRCRRAAREEAAKVWDYRGRKKAVKYENDLAENIAHSVSRRYGTPTRILFVDREKIYSGTRIESQASMDSVYELPWNDNFRVIGDQLEGIEKSQILAIVRR